MNKYMYNVSKNIQRLTTASCTMVNEWQSEATHTVHTCEVLVKLSKLHTNKNDQCVGQPQEHAFNVWGNGNSEGFNQIPIKAGPIDGPVPVGEMESVENWTFTDTHVASQAAYFQQGLWWPAGVYSLITETWAKQVNERCHSAVSHVAPLLFCCCLDWNKWTFYYLNVPFSHSHTLWYAIIMSIKAQHPALLSS